MRIDQLRAIVLRDGAVNDFPGNIRHAEAAAARFAMTNRRQVFTELGR